MIKERRIQLSPTRFGYRAVKRVFDIVFSFILLLICAVPIGIICLVVYIDSPGASPVFVQKRAGLGGKVFNFYKIRTMVADAEAQLDKLLDKNEMEGPAFKMKEDPRITKIGRFLRKTSLDELPQLWNIFRGDMSFVGPRPPLPREVELYDEEHMKRLSVTPGITCYWQIQKNRNDMTVEEWFLLDRKYIEERGFWVDVKIILKTFGAVLGMEGV